MIHLDIAALIFCYILFSSIIIFIFWLMFGYKGIKKGYSRKDTDYIWKCSVCLHIYVDSRHEDISTCPLCGSYNKRDESKKGVTG